MSSTYAALGKYMDLLMDAICVVDKDGHFIYVSGGCERIFGYSPEEMLGLQMLDLIYPEDRERTLEAVAQIVAGQPEPHFENRYLRKDGEIAHIMWSARWSEEDQCRVAVARDITLRKQAEAMQQAVYAIAEASQNTLQLAQLYPQIHQIIATLVPAANCMIGLYDPRIDSISFPYYCDQHNSAPEPHPLDQKSRCGQVIRTGQPLLLDAQEIAASNPPANGEATPARVYSWLGVPLIMQGNIGGLLVIKSYNPKAHYSDKTLALLQFVSTQIGSAIERHQMLARLQQRALYDQLTGLPNRELFYDRMHSAMARARRNQEYFSLLFIDLDKFKAVNDHYGHSVGDLLLSAVARRMELCVRQCDTVARFGGDEFVILLENIHQPKQVASSINQIAHQLSLPFLLEAHSLNISASIGVAHYPADGDNEQDLLRHADRAMYQRKQLTQ